LDGAGLLFQKVLKSWKREAVDLDVDVLGFES
jgi:hypothetical protein